MTVSWDISRFSPFPQKVSSRKLDRELGKRSRVGENFQRFDVSGEEKW